MIADFFLSMKRADTAGMRATLSPFAQLQATQATPDAEPTVMQQSIPNFMASVARTPPGALDERIAFETVNIDGPLASVWTPYQFYYNGRFSHCGANSFQLVRLQGKWLIQYIIDTRRKNCPSSQ